MINWYETPVTNRGSGRVRFQVSDWRRILENTYVICKLEEDAGYIDRQWSNYWRSVITSIFQNPHNYILRRELWEVLLTILTDAAHVVNYYPTYTLTNDMTYQNINNVETFILEIGEAIERYPQYALINQYTGDIERTVPGISQQVIQSGENRNAGGYYE